MNLEFLEGKKTYVVAIATISYALGGWVAGYLSLDQVIPLILVALGMGGIRHGITTNADMFEEPELPTPPTTPPETP